MLPWLVIPLIGLWALSQLFPPAFRFEITSPRLACVVVLVVTLGWYEVLMPKLSAWRARRNARLRERKRFEAIEMQKLRKTATRRCRNCLTPYRDQNPCGGKFMCSYCGHVSKRPILDLHVPPGLGLSNSGILRDLVGKGGKIWSDNRWMCGQDWLENGNWIGGRGSFVSKSDSWSKTGGGGFLGVDQCLAEKLYSRVYAFACKALTSFFLSIMWLCRKVFRISSSRSDASMDAERRAMMDKRGENGGNCQESKGEKARRKAEEKRLARLEKELAEEEERKQREEVARLVEERRKLRDEKMEAEKDLGKGSPSAKVRDSKREAEKKRQEKKKERDRGSSRSNSDAEELDKRQGKESARNRQGDDDRRHQHKNGPESIKTHNAEVIHGFKGASSSSHNHGNVSTRYLDRMRGTFLSSSRAFTGGVFFGKSNATNIPREQKSNTTIDPLHNASRRELSQPDRIPGKLNPNGDDRSMNRPVLIEPQPLTAPKKSWQQLFTRSSPPSSNVISRPIVKPQAEILSPSCQTSDVQSFDNPISFGLPSPFTLTSFPCGPTSCSTTIPSSPRAMHTRIGDGTSLLLAEELENFEDPCYVPDPVSLLGPVSESLDDFQLEVDLGFVSDTGLDNPCVVKNVNASSQVTRPSPIESPISRLRVPEERHAGSFLFPNTPNAQDMRTVPMNVSNNANEVGTWQMWNSSPLGQAGLSLIGSPTNWRLSTDLNTSNVPPTPPKTMASLFKNDEQLHSVCHSPHTVYTGSCQNGGTLSTVLPGSAESRYSKAPFGTYAGGESQFSLKSEDAAQGEVTYRSPNATATNHPFASSPPNWAKKEDWTSQRPGEAFGNSPMASASVGGLYSTPNGYMFPCMAFDQALLVCKSDAVGCYKWLLHKISLVTSSNCIQKFTICAD
ncbi:hypothetical protein K7X08_000107 [Anisodus acutangulus]|uniref:Uncharacterized protein n=1 Tax=Anisodus acutangulus TaxID=402998 RepID=A0A9Q1M7T4_9SOLA|nr:hypothetical protein K7X08_000107 [Anisodus acutangulus]